MRKRLFATLMLAAGMLFAAPAAALADNITISEGTAVTTPVVVNESSTITVSGDVVMSGSENAFEINADTTLVFDNEATLTLTGYDNAFVVSNATLSGGDWNITDDGGMDLFRLKTGGKLNVTSSVDLYGAGSTNTASRAIVLEGNGAGGQVVNLAANSTLAANGFYRGVETGGAENYYIKGADMDTSTFDFSSNDCGMAISYFDGNAHFEKCILEVSNCTSSGIFMRQDNAAINGLYIDSVNINCENASSLNQNDIAIRFHTVNFEITNSIINIENAWNTGLWICDGWDKAGSKKIEDCLISVKNVYEKDPGIVGTVMRNKAITFVPYGEWTIDNCDIDIEGSMSGGINVAADIKGDTSTLTASPSYYGGKIVFKNSSIGTQGIVGADMGAQVGQYIEIGENNVIDNGGADNHFTVLCDNPENGFPAVVNIFGQNIVIPLSYDIDDLPEVAREVKRVTVTGGSYWSTRDEELVFDYAEYGDDDTLKFFDESVPVNQFGDELSMVVLSPEAYETCSINGVITLTGNLGSGEASTEEYAYRAEETSVTDPNRYIWAPCVVVTLDYGDGTTSSVNVPYGWTLGSVAELPNGEWTYSDENGTQQSFSDDEALTSDITVSLMS